MYIAKIAPPKARGRLGGMFQFNIALGILIAFVSNGLLAESVKNIGSFGYIASLSLVAWGFFEAHYAMIPVCVFAFIAAHAIGQGAVIWVFISEIFPNRHRARGQSLGSFTHWIFAALLTTFFPKMVSALPAGYVFSFFAGMMCLQLLWVKTMVPETKNIPLEQLQKELALG